MQLDTLRSLLLTDLRTQCIAVAACLTALLPLEIHHLVAMILGAAGYMFLQQLEPSVRRREPLKAPRRLTRYIYIYRCRGTSCCIHIPCEWYYGVYDIKFI